MGSDWDLKMAMIDAVVHNPDPAYQASWAQSQRHIEELLVNTIALVRAHQEDGTCHQHGCPGSAVLAMISARIMDAPGSAAALMAMAFSYLGEDRKVRHVTLEELAAEHYHSICDTCKPHEPNMRDPSRPESECCVCGQMNRSGIFVSDVLPEAAKCKIGRELKVPDVIPD